MRRILIPLIAGVVALGITPSALAGGTREDRYYVVACDDGNTYEAVDAHAVEQGGKAHAVWLFSHNTPFGLDCWLTGPFGS
jgi:hypothetical protein